MLELGEHLLDRVEVGAAGRKEQQAGARASDRRAHPFGFVAAEIVHDDDVAASERRDQLGFDIGLEGGAVGRSVQNPRGGAPHRGDPFVGDRCQDLAGDAAGFQKAPDRDDARRAASVAKPVPQPRQGDRRAGLDLLQDPCSMALQLRLAVYPPIRLGPADPVSEYL